LNKKHKNNETVYLYVHKFKWLKKKEGDHFRGHLKEGRVYKADLEYPDEMDGETLYKIDLLEDEASPSGIALLELSGKFDSWTCELQIIDDEALLDLDITEEDMEMIALDESQYMPLETNTIDGAEFTVTEDVSKEEFEVGVTMGLIQELNSIDPEMVKFLMLLVQGTTDILKDKEYITLTGHMSNLEGRAGRIANTTLISAHLEAHLNSDSNNPANLMNAIFTILLELKRTVKIS
jgi:hypothetical protein